MWLKIKNKSTENEPNKNKGFCRISKKPKLLKFIDEKETTFIITRVTIEKGNHPFGITISGGIDQPLEDETSNTMAVVHTVSNNQNSPVYNKLFPGDCIISVDGESMEGKCHSEIVQLFSEKVGTIVLEVKRTVKTDSVYKHFNTLIVKHQWLSTNECNEQQKEYGFDFELNSWPSYCHPDVKNVVVLSVDVKGPAYGTILPRDIIISINNQILFGYTPDEIDNLIKSCNGKMVLEILRKTKSDGAELLTNIANSNGFVDNNYSPMMEIKLEKKSDEVYGFGIVGGIDDCPLFVANVDAFSHAEDAGIKSCSVIHRMNSKDTSFMSHEDAVKLIATTNTLNLLLEYNEKLHQDLQKFINGTKPASKIKILNHSTYRSVAFSSQSDNSASSSEFPSADNENAVFDIQLEPLRQFTIKALFNFDADSEKSLPARGLTFAFGDLLQVTNGNDEEWWQAAPLNPTGTLNRRKPMGLIPSQNLLNYRLQRKSKKVKFTPKVETINHKNSISTNSQKAAVRNLHSPAASKSSLAKKSYSTLTVPLSNAERSKKSIQSNCSNIFNNDDVMYLIVEPITLDSQFKRPIFVVGSYAERIHLTLEQQDPKLYQFLPLKDSDQQQKIPTLRQTIDLIAQKSQSGVHTLISQDQIPLDIILYNNLHIILLMFKPPNVDWIMKRDKHLTHEEASVELKYLNNIHNKYRHCFTRIFNAPEAYQDALHLTLNAIKENSSNQMWIPVMNVTQF